MYKTVSLVKFKDEFWTLIANDIDNTNTGILVRIARWQHRFRMRSALVRTEGASNSSLTGSWTHTKVHKLELAS